MISMDSTSLNTSFMVESQDKSVYEPSCKNDHWKFIPWPNVIKKWFETTTWGGFLRWQLVAGAQPGTHITRRDFISGGFDLGEWNPWFWPWKFGWLPVNRPIIQCWDSIHIYPELLVDCFCMFLECQARIISSTPVEIVIICHENGTQSPIQQPQSHTAWPAEPRRRCPPNTWHTTLWEENGLKLMKQRMKEWTTPHRFTI